MSTFPNTFLNRGAISINNWATQQPDGPTVWPPPPPPPNQQLAYAGQIPWREWVESLAVRPYVTDPPPCPVVVSRYPGLSIN